MIYCFECRLLDASLRKKDFAKVFALGQPLLCRAELDDNVLL
jgi:hypothetical protein